ncbi:hypothetical protein AYO44_14270 [Planctomycetaceae bacterium SCGC AG-212-F19]|nr:hypothetical protein AYO44_14270 [Planctomycetaceae bacterium SCGC AG-212-F19]
MGKKKLVKPPRTKNNPLKARRPAAGQPAPAKAGDAKVLEQLRTLRAENERLRSAFVTPKHDEPGARVLPDDVRQERARIAAELPIPGRTAAHFNLVNDFLSIGVIPWADPLVPAYFLDKNYRIVDWNIAFGVAYDRTMDGRRGLSVLEWVYFLDNYEESIRKATNDFGDPHNLPRLHVETIKYTSMRYGPTTATKRAYQMPKDNGEMLGWLVTLDVDFQDLKTKLQFKRDLFATLRRDLTWSEYALSYDRVLNSTNVYPDLLNHILGEPTSTNGNGRPAPIHSSSRILDLGAGTGNLARLLASQQRGHVVFALENNRMMLDLLRAKCDAFLRSDDNGPGVLALKQDVNTLFGLPDDSFDYAILNNLAYSLEDPLPCFRQICKALTAEGEIRVSGPQKKTKLEQLFGQISAELRACGRMEELREDYTRVWDINRNILSSSLYRWSVEDMRKMLGKAGFNTITYATDSAYGGQAMIVAARK